MSATTKPKGKTHFRYGWKLSPKAKALRFQPRSIVGARKILSRVEMNAQLRAPLTAFSAPMPPSVLTTAIVVIHGMTVQSFWSPVKRNDCLDISYAGNESCAAHVR